MIMTDPLAVSWNTATSETTAGCCTRSSSTASRRHVPRSRSSRNSFTANSGPPFPSLQRHTACRPPPLPVPLYHARPASRPASRPPSVPPSVPATIWAAAHTTAHVGSPSRPSSYLLRRAARRDSPRQKKAEERKQGNARRRLKKVMHGVAAAQHLKMIAEAAGFDKHKQFTWPADAWAWAAERRSGDRSLLL